MKKVLLVFFLAWFSVATTYVIKEDGAEVGRWTEEDGQDVEKVIEQATVERAPQPERPAYEPIAPSRYEWYEDAKGHDAVIKAQDKFRQPAALYFYATWCPHCRTFESNVLYTDKVGNYLSGFPHVRIDVDKEKDLVKKYGVTAFPTFLVRLPDGKVKKARRTQAPETFIDSLKTSGLKK